MSDLRQYIKQREARDPEFKATREASQAEFDVALQIARLRNKRQVTQQQLADLIGTKQSAISRIESGDCNMTVDMLEKVAAALNSRLHITLVPEDDDAAFTKVHA